MTNEQYEAARNALIRSAEMHANKIVGYRPRDSSAPMNRAMWANEWNRVFFRRMNELAAAAKLVRG